MTRPAMIWCRAACRMVSRPAALVFGATLAGGTLLMMLGILADLDGSPFARIRLGIEALAFTAGALLFAAALARRRRRE